jgi:hypothetical protein
MLWGDADTNVDPFVSVLAELMFTYGRSHADHYGRYDASPAKWAREVVPGRATNHQVAQAIALLKSAVDDSGVPLIKEYMQGGKKYVYFPKFFKHQSYKYDFRIRAQYPHPVTGFMEPSMQYRSVKGICVTAEKGIPETYNDVAEFVTKIEEYVTTNGKSRHEKAESRDDSGDETGGIDEAQKSAQQTDNKESRHEKAESRHENRENRRENDPPLYSSLLTLNSKQLETTVSSCSPGAANATGPPGCSKPVPEIWNEIKSTYPSRGNEDLREIEGNAEFMRSLHRGRDALEIRDGVNRYRAYCDSTPSGRDNPQTTGTRYVMSMKSFFEGEEWRKPWAISPKQQTRSNGKRIESPTEFKQRLADERSKRDARRSGERPVRSVPGSADESAHGHG